MDRSSIGGKRAAIAALLLGGVLPLGPVLAGSLDSPAAPTDPASAMYRLEDLYNRLDTGASGSQSVFTEPGWGPTAGTGHTLNQVMGKAPATNGNAAVAGDVLGGKAFWGLGSAAWGLGSGSMPNCGALTLVPGTASQAIPQGYHNGSGSVSGDANLVAGNIKAGISIFGVSGKTEVVDTTSGDATAGDVLAGRKVWVDGAEITGALPARTLSGASDGMLAGYYSATTLSVVDADLNAANIRSGATIFGVSGKTEVVDTTSGDAVVGDLLSGKKAWVDGIEITGTLGTQTLSATNAAVQAGYYAATTLPAVETDLVSANIRAGVTLFGISGDSNVVNTATGDATPADVAAGRKAWVAGTEITGSAAPGGVPRTGAGVLALYTHSDGEDGNAMMRKGTAWPNPRFTDNANGTVTDNLTGLIWLKDANAFGTRTWDDALVDCATLNSGEHGLTDGSAEGAWRLPNVRELQSLIDYGRNSPALCDAAGTGQWTSGSPFTGVQSARYWSSTTVAGGTTSAWFVNLLNGWVYFDGKGFTWSVWPVRGGP